MVYWQRDIGVFSAECHEIDLHKRGEAQIDALFVKHYSLFGILAATGILIHVITAFVLSIEAVFTDCFTLFRMSD